MSRGRVRLACLTAVLALMTPVRAQFENVGTLKFPTSGTPEAQKHFLRGVAILHSFGWKQAIAEFQAAQRLQPDFAMAYWGETLCYNHPLQGEQDAETPRKVLARLGPTTEARLAKAPTDREKGFLGAVELLWGDGEYRSRRVKYMEAMGRLHERYPDDDEVATFYAVALLSGARAIDDNSFRLEMKAGAIAQRVFQTNPNHPGAAHYIIHAFDDPIHAPLSLTAAHAYAKIAPAVSHARHMPTHIFIQHGMWRLVAAQNDSAYEAARDLWEPGDTVGDMIHALDWGQYGYLQLGDYARAAQSIDLVQQVLDKSKATRARGAASLTRARYVVETEQWKVEPVADDASADALLAAGMSAARTGDLAAAEKIEARLKALTDRQSGTAPAAADAHAAHGPTPPPAPGPGGPDAGKSTAIMYREVAALVRLARSTPDEAVRLLTEATRIEESMRPPNGSADPIKPSHELFGEVLLELGRPADAVKQFETSLIRMPNRARSLIGSARAYAKTGARGKAAEQYRKLIEIWQGRDTLPAYREAVQFLSSDGM